MCRLQLLSLRTATGDRLKKTEQQGKISDMKNGRIRNMKTLTSILCLSVAVLLGSTAVSWGADFQKGLTAARSGDFKTAMREWLPLAQQGNARAQNGVGMFYRDGRGVPKNIETAIRWFTLSAKQGDMRGQWNLGRAYARGTGVPQNNETAVKWLTLSASQGFDLAKKDLAIVKKNIQTGVVTPRRAANPNIVITVTSMKDDQDYRKKSLCKLKFSITNNAFGTIHRISAKLTGYDDRGEKLDELLSANASNRRGFSLLPIAKGSTVNGVGNASFKVKCKYFAKLKYDGIDEDDCAMRMLPENVSCSKITTLRSRVPSIKMQN